MSFDITTSSPRLLTTLHPASTNVMQCVVQDPVTRNFFTSQATSVGAATGTESNIVSRMSKTGAFIDSMTLTSAGHGTVFGVEHATDGKVYLWWTWQEAVAGGSKDDLVRFEYRPGAVLSRSQTSFFTVLPKFEGNSHYLLMALDWANDYVALRDRNDAAGTVTWTRRKISDLRAGVNVVYGQFTEPIGSTVFQAHATIDDTLYVYSGSGDITHGARKVVAYSWDTGRVTSSIDTMDLGANADGTYPGNYAEPEGASVYIDASGNPVLLVGVTTGQTQARTYDVFVYDGAVVRTGVMDLPNKQFELGGVRWGLRRPIFTEEGGFDAGTAEPRAQEVSRPMGDGVMFGVDYIDPPTWAWTVGLNATSEEEALKLLAPLATVWRNNAGRGTTGTSMPLRYSLAGRVRRVYGRPRHIGAPKMDTRIDVGYAQTVLDFKCEDHLHYDDEEQSVTLELTNSASGGGWVFPTTFPIYTQGGGSRDSTIFVDGDAPTHFTATIAGPIAGPTLVGSGWAFDLDVTLGRNQSITIDTRAATVLRNDGASAAGTLSRRSRVGRARLRGGNQDLTFTGSDSSGTATCTVRWRPAHHSL